jgi:phosphonate transport system substrate-binding protein
VKPRPAPPRRGGFPLGLRLALTLALAVGFLASCGGSTSDGARRPLSISAVPDQDPEKLQRLYGSLARYLEKNLEIPVAYRPVTDYAAAVSLFRTGDLDLVWFGGLTGVQARLQVRGAQALVQRDIDETFHSVFIAHPSSGVRPVDHVAGLAQLRGRRFTFGSESSTSGRLMPQFFLEQAGMRISELAGPPGYSGSHDRTIELVKAGTYEAGALNEQVWASRLASSQVNSAQVVPVFRTPPYHDYHWVVRPDVEGRYGQGFLQKLKSAFLQLDSDDPAEREVLELFGAGRFIETNNGNYDEIEAVGRRAGLIN